MEKRKFGKTDMAVSVLGFGGAEIGFQNVSEGTVKTLLNGALANGLNVIDTAECYRGSEELIGKAVSDRRNDYYLFTKCGHGEDYNMHTEGENLWGKNDIAKSIDRSLKRLKTDYIDLIQLHSCSAEILKHGEAIEAVQAAKQAGKVRYIGYSGDGNDALFAVNTGVFDTLQTSISIADQQAIDLTIPLAVKQNMGVIAKRPIANAAWRHKTRPAGDYGEIYWQRLQKLKYEFINGNPDIPGDIALRFTLSVPGVHVAIVGTTKLERFKKNAEVVATGPLADDEFQKIREHWLRIATTDWVGQV